MVEQGDKHIGRNSEVVNHSEINFLSVSEVRSPEVAVQKEITNRIARTQDTLSSTFEKLAAYYPNGLQGVLESMVPGPAYDQLASMLQANSSNIA